MSLTSPNRRNAWPPLRYVVLFCLLTASPALLAAQPSTPPPQSEDEPLLVEASCYIVDVRRILDAEQSIDADVLVRLEWVDPRLADPDAGQRWLELDDVWSPPLIVLQPRSVAELLPETVVVDGAGRISYTQRFSGTFGAPTHLSEFPFDEHRFRIPFVLGRRQGVHLEIRPGPIGGMSAELSIPDWSLGAARLDIAEVHIGEGIPELPGFALEFPAARLTSHYLTKVIFPLIVIIMMSWTVFWAPPPQIAIQFGFAATSILTVIAYRFALASQVPPVPYGTRLDAFLNGAFILAFLALVEVIITARLIYRERTPQAERLDRTCRVVFPLVLAAIFVYSFVV